MEKKVHGNTVDLFSRMVEQAEADDMTESFSEKASIWYNDLMRQQRRVKLYQLRATPSIQIMPRTQIKRGRLYQFKYIPKGIETLEYYDMYPLVIPIEKYENGFLGLNLHYVPPASRAILLNLLMQLWLIDTNNILSTRLRSVNYDRIKARSKSMMRIYKPCVKRYLTDHIEPPNMIIPLKHWEHILFLPTSRFRGRKKNYVWRQSRKIIRKRN